MRKSAFLTGLLLMAAFAAATAQAGDYYKWTDAQGTVHYSQTPPLDHASSALHVTDGAPTPPLSGMRNGPVAPEQKPKAKSGQSAIERADKQVSSANCSTAQKNIANLQGHGMVVASGDPDKARALDPEQREQALADARTAAATYCAHKP